MFARWSPARARGAILYGAEQVLACGWMLGELALVAARLDELVRPDPHWPALQRDIEARGFYPALDAAALRESRGWLVGDNPYVRIGAGSPDRVVAKAVRARGRARHLVIVCHCYGVPNPAVMERLFGLRDLEAVDVVYNIANHHARGSFPAWPGSGFFRAWPSWLLENLRSAISGLRALVEWHRRTGDYDKVTVLGYSLGGQLALHLANSAPIDRAILYCPVVDAHLLLRELGLGILGIPLAAAMQRWHPHVDRAVVAALTNPLLHPTRIADDAIHIIAQRHDAMTPLHQFAALRQRYPRASFRAYSGTHLYPADAPEFRRVIRSLL